MWLKRWLDLTLGLALLLVLSSCSGRALTTGAELTPDRATSLAYPTMTATPTTALPPTDTPTPTHTPTDTPTDTPPPLPTATATSSEGAPAQPPAGENIFNNWSAANTDLSLALDADGRPTVLFVASNADGSVAMRTQQTAGGWTDPNWISPAFHFLYDLTAVPDASGRLCAYWSGQPVSDGGDEVDAFYRNCAGSGGGWLPVAEKAALNTFNAVYAPARAPDGTLHAAYIGRPGAVYALFYSPIHPIDPTDLAAAVPLTGTQLSGDLDVLVSRLAVDPAGGLHAAWVESTSYSDLHMLARYSADGGQTWDAPQALYAGSINDIDELSFRLVADAVGQVHLVWGADNAIYYARWAAGGWETPVELAPSADNALQFGAALAVGPDGLALVAWDEFKGGSAQVLLRVQSAAGEWGEAQTVTPTQGNQLALAVSADGVTHIVWDGDDGLRYLTLP